jgi:hypothetical protein
MYQALLAGPDLDAFEPTCFADWDRQDEIPVLVAPAGGKDERLPGGQDQIGFPQFPSFGEFWPGRQIGGFALNTALLHPFLNRGNFPVGEAEFVGKS